MGIISHPMLGRGSTYVRAKEPGAAPKLLKVPPPNTHLPATSTEASPARYIQLPHRPLVFLLAFPVTSRCAARCLLRRPRCWAAANSGRR